MKVTNLHLVAIFCFGLVFLPHESAFADDACTAAPCLNGGVCSTIQTWAYSCSCTAGFLGPTCAYAAVDEEESIAENYSYSGFGTNQIGWVQGSEKSGLGQYFTAAKSGFLEKVSFEIYPTDEAVNRPEPLIMEFWNVDESGVPTGSPLASRILDGSSFVPMLTQIRTVDFSADNIKLKSSTQYAFTLRVDHKSTTDSYGLYLVSGNSSPPDDYPGGKMVATNNGEPWRYYGDYDWSKFQVTALTPLFENGFEFTTP